MEERLWRRLAALGWGGVPIEEACLNIIWLYVAGGFELAVLRPFFDEDGSPRGDLGDGSFAAALGSVAAMLDEAERLGRLDYLAAPTVKTPDQIISMLSRRFGEIQQEPQVCEARRKRLS
jgi:hypothetical protein